MIDGVQARRLIGRVAGVNDTSGQLFRDLRSCDLLGGG